MPHVKEEKIDDRFLVQVPDDLESVNKLPLAEHIAQLKLKACGKPPKAKVIEETKLVDTYGIKTRKMSLPSNEYFTIGGTTIENPNIALLARTYGELGLNPKIRGMQIQDGSNDKKIVWRAGHGHLTAIARDGKILTEKAALELAQEVGGHVCKADVIKKEMHFELIRCMKA